MRLSTVFVSTAFVLAGMSAALPGESENILARFADDFLAEVDARAYDEESELYAQRGAISTKNHKPRSATPHYGSSEYDNGLVLSRDGSGGTPPYTSHFRRSFYEPPRYELTRRRIPNDRSSPPTTPIPDTPSSPPRDWRSRLEGSPPTTPGERTPSSSRPGSPDSGRSRSPEWLRPPNGSHYRRSFSEPPRYELTRRREFHPAPDDEYSPPTTPGISTPPTPGTPSSPVRDWRSRFPRPSSPAGSAPTTPGVRTPSSSRPGSPDSGRSRSPDWYRPRNRRSFYDLD
ncbi:hypothetical protein JOM56_001398 [Amanita muscaria]